MTVKLPDVQRNDLIRENRAGATIKYLARKYDVTDKVVRRLLGSDAITARARMVARLAGAVAAFESGDSVNAISKRLGVSRNVIDRHLRRHGIQPRGHSAAETVKWSRMTPEQRVNQTAKAHKAATGRRVGPDELVTRAEARQRGRSHVSPYETQLADMLRERGIETIPQLAIGPYNCDLAASPVAVEVWGGNWHWYGSHIARTKKRLPYLLNSGWHVLIVPVTGRNPLTPAVADYVAAEIQRLRSDPTSARQYRVIWRAGKFTTGGRADDDHLAVKPPFANRRDPATGQYTSVTG